MTRDLRKLKATGLSLSWQAPDGTVSHSLRTTRLLESLKGGGRIHLDSKDRATDVLREALYYAIAAVACFVLWRGLRNDSESPPPGVDVYLGILSFVSFWVALASRRRKATLASVLMFLAILTPSIVVVTMRQVEHNHAKATEARKARERQTLLTQNQQLQLGGTALLTDAVEPELGDARLLVTFSRPIYDAQAVPTKQKGGEHARFSDNRVWTDPDIGDKLIAVRVQIENRGPSAASLSDRIYLTSGAPTGYNEYEAKWWHGPGKWAEPFRGISIDPGETKYGWLLFDVNERDMSKVDGVALAGYSLANDENLHAHWSWAQRRLEWVFVQSFVGGSATVYPDRTLSPNDYYHRPGAVTKTKDFQLTTGEVQLRWRLTQAGANYAPWLEVYLVNRQTGEGGNQSMMSMDVGGPDLQTDYYHRSQEAITLPDLKRPGTYHAEVLALNCSWTLRIYEHRWI